MNLRGNIYGIIELGDKDSIWSRIYDSLMLIMICISIVPLAFRTQYPIFDIFDTVAVVFFILDYLLRWMTADMKMVNRPKWQAFVLYPITPMAILDLLSILPSLSILGRLFKLFRITRLLKLLRVFRFVRYSRDVQILQRVILKEKNILTTVFVMAIAYIFITALIMFNIEQTEMFGSYFDALYWATSALTTVGYGDIYPMTDMGRAVSMFSSLVGIAIIALPSGVITAGYLEEIREEKEKKNQPKNE